MSLIKYLILLFSFSNMFSQVNLHLLGKVVDEENMAINLANIYVNNELKTFSDESGSFDLKIGKDDISKAVITITYPYKKKFYINNLSKFINEGDKIRHTFILIENSITIKEVEVPLIPKKKTSSNSSIIFDEETILQTQSFSINDVLKLLPGKITSPPDLNNYQNLTLRSDFQTEYGGKSFNYNNSFGVSVIIDDVLQSNDANMQTKSLSKFGLLNASENNSLKYSISDGAYQGIDLRNISTENIENIEVIQGIASAKYGDMTDGAVIVERKAGRTPYNFIINAQYESTSFSFSKGFLLSKSLGNLNLSLNYSYSNIDPRDKIQEYNRITQSLMWTKSFKNKIRNTFSFTYNRSLDDVKRDPDEQYQNSMFSKNYNISVSDRISIYDIGKYIDNIKISSNISIGESLKENQFMMNRLPFPVANKDTLGIYEGFYIGGRYLAVERIEGKPLRLNNSFNLIFNSFGDIIRNTIGLGVSHNYYDNLGNGTVYDPKKPRWAMGNNMQNERPYNFKGIPPTSNIGFYLENNFILNVFNKEINGNIGVRGDLQNSFFSFQPRLNVRYNYSKNTTFSFGYGISSKAPSLAHRYPSPIWLDFPLIEAFDPSDISKSLFLVYTHKMVPDNSSIKPSKSEQIEIGVNYQNSFLISSIYGYYKKNWNGFSSKRVFFPISLPQYELINPEQGKPKEYQPTGEYEYYHNYYYNVVTNSLKSKTFGVDINLSSKYLNFLNSKIILNNTILYSDYFDNNEIIEDIQDIDSEMLYRIYEPVKTRVLSSMSKIGIVFHIPNLGVLLNFNSDLFWLNKNLSKENKLVAYLDKNMNRIEAKSKIINEKERKSHQPIYGIVNLNISKEIKKNLRIGINIYNFFNVMKTKNNYDDDADFRYSNPSSISGSISVKF